MFASVVVAIASVLAPGLIYPPGTDLVTLRVSATCTTFRYDAFIHAGLVRFTPWEMRSGSIPLANGYDDVPLGTKLPDPPPELWFGTNDDLIPRVVQSIYDSGVTVTIFDQYNGGVVLATATVWLPPMDCPAPTTTTVPRTTTTAAPQRATSTTVPPRATSTTYPGASTPRRASSASSSSVDAWSVGMSSPLAAVRNRTNVTSASVTSAGDTPCSIAACRKACHSVACRSSSSNTIVVSPIPVTSAPRSGILSVSGTASRPAGVGWGRFALGFVVGATAAAYALRRRRDRRP